jgi:hypothetical protein
VRAAGPAGSGGDITFHDRLTVLVHPSGGLGAWLAAALGPADGSPLADDAVTISIDGECRSGAAGHASAPVRCWTGDDLRSLETALAHDPPLDRAGRQLAVELGRWEQVLAEAASRLAVAQAAAPHAEVEDLAEGAKLRDEWRYSVQVDRAEHRRRSRREAQARKQEFDDFLARFGAASFDELSTVGTGFGDTDGDIAIREAATVVAMAEQRVNELRAELAAARDATRLTGRVERLLTLALEHPDDSGYRRPVILDGVFDQLDPDTHGRAFALLLVAARTRQVIVVTASEDVAAWASSASPDDAALRRELEGVALR